ncbi:cytochrome p450 2u1 [Plakobranchus ocellatus]|uniref:Cytochrome p450 2u1 n=1 Tax=Plakobranchus ocellatus TaxID=259542 RepID=A0AAV4ASW9_9GAST|nr:cytochrome p450 2u1 [Plakobranchus ocellatus]
MILEWRKEVLHLLQQTSTTTKAVVAAAVAVLIIRWMTKKQYKLPPGPRPLPLLGNILELRGVSILDKLDEWKQKYGPIVTCYMGPRMFIVLNDFESMNEAYVKQGSDFSSRPMLYSMEVISDGFKDIALAPYGEVWKYQRKITSLALRQYLMGDQLENRVHETLQPIIESLKKHIESFTDSIILAQQQALQEDDPTVATVFTDDHAKQILADVFSAGLDASRQTLDWLLLVLVAYPDTQRKMQEEIDRVVGKAVPGKEHKAKLVYTEAVLLETMRLYYVAPIGLPHETMRDTTVGGYEVPAKVTVLTNSMAMMRDPKLWSDPLHFIPERFIGSNEDGSGSTIVSRHVGWAPFSIGHRTCIGESVAKLELVFIVAGLLQKLSFSYAPQGEQKVPNMKHSTKGVTFLPEPYYIKVSSRGN